jgi:hypothetical protein
MKVVSSKANFERVYTLLQYDDPLFQEHGVWIFHNIIVDNEEAFKIVLNSHFIFQIQKIINQSSSIPLSIISISLLAWTHRFYRNYNLLNENYPKVILKIETERRDYVGT